MRKMKMFAGLLVAMLALTPSFAVARGSKGHSSKSSSGAHPERTEGVRGYTRKDGKTVAPDKRAPRGQGKTKKKKP